MPEENSTSSFETEPTVVIEKVSLEIPEMALFLGSLLFLIVGCILGLSGSYLNPKDPNAILEAAKISAEKTQVEYNISCLRRESETRLRIVDECVKRSGVPEILNNNITCKILK